MASAPRWCWAGFSEARGEALKDWWWEAFCVAGGFLSSVLPSFDVYFLLSRVNMCCGHNPRMEGGVSLYDGEKRRALAGVRPATWETELELIAGLWIAYFT